MDHLQKITHVRKGDSNGMGFMWMKLVAAHSWKILLNLRQDEADDSDFSLSIHFIGEVISKH